MLWSYSYKRPMMKMMYFLLLNFMVKTSHYNSFQSLWVQLSIFKDSNFDALFIFCHVLGHSAYNAVEGLWCHCPTICQVCYYLSIIMVLIWAILEEPWMQHEKWSTSAEVWNQTVIDGYSVIAQSEDLGSQIATIPPSDTRCCNEQVQQSQYLLQIVV